jgi:hypothetical protein
MRDPIWIHWHVPKTGGQTIRTALSDHLEIDQSFVHLGTWATQKGFAITSNTDLASLAPPARDRIRVVTGHKVNEETVRLFGNRDVRKLVILRSPASRIVSLFNFKRSLLERRGLPPVDFDEWYESLGPNSMTRFLSRRLGVGTEDLDGVLRELRDFLVVGKTEEMDTWLPDLFATLGLPPMVPDRVNVAGVDHERLLSLDDRLSQRIFEDHPLDFALYNAVDEMCDQSRARLRDLAESVDSGVARHT